MIHVEPKDLSVRQVQAYLLGGVGPRPIALVSTLSVDGVPNLAPFSFFNAFGANPPMIGFSPSRRVRDGSLKDTYNNLVATRQCVVQAVSYTMVQQVSLASTEYPADVDEFIKTGLTVVPSDIVKPPRVKQSPFQMECVLRQMISLGEAPGSGNLALCEVVKFHIAEDILKDGVIHPDLIDLVGRQSADFYARASGSAIFEVVKPIEKKGVGIDQLPEYIRASHVLSANNLAQLANVERIPDPRDAFRLVASLSCDDASEGLFYHLARQRNHVEMLKVAITLHRQDHPKGPLFVECAARRALENNDVTLAWQALLYLGASYSDRQHEQQ
ncbi:MAG TPA: flavin reductase family protein [Candidatus Deferrimicrobium sp.]|nr:flavin reductase family protein [Candidatus Deferrimicrobium sp.]